MAVSRDIDSPLLPTNSDSRKRASKACDRCKLKKVKCCGSKPCSRCQADDALCHYGATSKADVKPISAARANQLEHQQVILIKALRLLWQRCSPPPSEGTASVKNPSVHEIVRALGLLQGSSDTLGTFEEVISAVASSNNDTPEPSDPAFVDYVNDHSQTDLDMEHNLGIDMFANDTEVAHLGLPDLSMLDAGDFSNWIPQTTQEMFSSISTRRGYGDTLSLGPLPNFDPFGNTSIQQSENNNGYSYAPQQLEALNPAAQVGDQGVSYSDQSVAALKPEDTFSEFTTITPS